MLRNYMNEGGKVVFSGRNGWVQQTSTGTGLKSYSGYTLVAGARVRVRLPADQAGDDDRPHTAFFRELDISNDWGQWWLGIDGRQGGVGTTTYNAALGPCERDGFLAGMPDIALDTTAGAGRHARADGERDDGRGRASRRRSRRGCATSRSSRRAGSRSSVRSARSGSKPTTAGDEHAGRSDHLHARRGLDRVRARADRRPGPREQLVRSHDEPPAAGDGRHHGADGHVAAARRRGDGQRRRPGRDRGRGASTSAATSTRSA